MGLESRSATCGTGGALKYQCFQHISSCINQKCNVCISSCTNQKCAICISSCTNQKCNVCISICTNQKCNICISSCTNQRSNQKCNICIGSCTNQKCNLFTVSIEYAAFFVRKGKPGVAFAFGVLCIRCFWGLFIAFTTLYRSP